MPRADNAAYEEFQYHARAERRQTAGNNLVCPLCEIRLDDRESHDRQGADDERHQIDVPVFAVAACLFQDERHGADHEADEEQSRLQRKSGQRHADQFAEGNDARHQTQPHGDEKFQVFDKLFEEGVDGFDQRVEDAGDNGDGAAAHARNYVGNAHHDAFYEQYQRFDDAGALFGRGNRGGFGGLNGFSGLNSFGGFSHVLGKISH